MKINIFNSKNKFVLYAVEFALVLSIILLAASLRLYRVNVTPGYEWDEPVYAQIAYNFEKLGYPTLKQEGNSSYLPPYLYHPPYDPFIRSEWYRITNTNGIMSARILSIIGSITLLGIIYFLFREFESQKVALISLLLLATDGWLIYTNRLNLMENLMMPLGVLGIAAYMFALRHKKLLYFALAGTLIGATAVYKHTGIYFLLIPFVNLFLIRKHTKEHILLGVFSALIIVTYILSMYYAWGNLYLTQTVVQIERTTGIIGSRGLNYSLNDGIQAIVNTYWIYITTIITLFWGTIQIGIDLFRYIKNKIAPQYSLLFSWSVSSVAFLGTISLKAPQYLVLALIPLYIYLTAIYIPKITQKRHQVLMYCVLGLALLLNAFTWEYRFYNRTDNALKSTYEYINEKVPKNAVIFTEESIGSNIEQTYYKLDNYDSAQAIETIKPDYVVIYLSTTQKPPNTTAFITLLSKSKLVKEFIGFKEKIYIYKTETTKYNLDIFHNNTL